MNDIQQESIVAYISAWNTLDPKDMKQALAHCVVPDVIYSDPFTDSTTGIDALVAVMASDRAGVTTVTGINLNGGMIND
ncbi:nuclear transport factor 2 family protein [bacterium]|nr:nuclear transport factor 2 family protein [bacterium]